MKIQSRKLVISIAVASVLSACSSRSHHSGAKPAVAPKPTESAASPTASAEPGPQLPAEESKAVAQIETKLPAVTADQTEGGRLFLGYVQGTVAGQDVVRKVFSDDDEVMNTLGDISLAIEQQKNADGYDASSSSARAMDDKIRVLNVALTEYFNDRREFYKNVENGSEILTSVAVGTIGGIFSDRVISWLGSLRASNIYSASKDGVSSAMRSLGGRARNVANWLRGKKAAEIEGDAVANTISRGHRLYLASVKAYGLSPTVATSEIVTAHLERALGKDLTRGVKVGLVPESEVANLEKQIFNKTGRKGFFFRRDPNSEVVTVKQMAQNGKYEYYQLTGDGVFTSALDNQMTHVSTQEMAALIAENFSAKSWAKRNLVFITDQGKKIETSVSVPAVVTADAGADATAAATASALGTSPTRTRLARAGSFAAVAVPLGTATYIGLRQIDTRYLFLDDYVRNLEKIEKKDGNSIDVEKFNDRRRELEEDRAKTNAPAAPAAKQTAQQS